MKTRVAVLCAFAFLFAPSLMVSCGPFFPYAVFVATSQPDIPDKQFVAGDIGIVKSTWQSRYRVMAFRYLANKPLTTAEQQTLLEASSLQQKGDPADAAVTNAIERWTRVRSHAPSPPSQTPSPDFLDREQYMQIRNCHADAFNTAADRLQQHIREYGADSPVVSAWAALQDVVFAACSAPQPIPPDASTPSPDLAYQRASIDFYSFRFEQAAAQFMSIAQKEASPYKQLARYLLLRNAIREAGHSASPAAFERPLTLANALLADSSMRAFWPATRRLEEYALARSRPQQYFSRLSSRLEDPAGDPDIATDLFNYAFMLNRLVPADETATDLDRWMSATAATGLPSDDARQTQWQNVLGRLMQKPSSPLFARWKQSHTDVWLVAALMHAQPQNPELDDIIAAAQTVSPGAPAYSSVQFYLAVLLQKTGRIQPARAVYDHLLQVPLSLSDRNLVREAMLPLARDPEEWLALAHLKPAGAAWEYEPDLQFLQGSASQQAFLRESWFTDDAARILNRCASLDRLARIAEGGQLPEPLRTQLQGELFARAFVLHSDDVQARMARLLATSRPEVRAIFEAYLKQTADSRVKAALAILHVPELDPRIRAGLPRGFDWYSQAPDWRVIDNFRQNWWTREYHPTAQTPPEPPIACPAALEATPRAEEEYAIVKNSDAQKSVIPVVLEWANSSPKDPQVPEALSLAVRMTRYSYPQNATLSCEAFHLLHRRYAGTVWAKKTPFCYGTPQQ